MMYPRKYEQRRANRAAGFLGNCLMFLLLVGAFVYGVYWFRQPKIEPSPEETATTDLRRQSPLLSSLDTHREIVGEETAELQDARLEKREGKATGTAIRQLQNGVFRHTLKTVLPPIDREKYFYEGWLLRQAPYDYFSTGEMVTNELGQFVLEFAGDPRGEYADYTKVIVTLETDDDNAAPGEHILEGEFTAPAKF